MIGTTLRHYAIDGRLGEGGMGTVYRARDTLLKRTVAIKVLAANDPESAHRLLREARAASALNHPNIVTIYAVEQQDDTAFIVMEHVEGDSLDRIIPSEGLAIDRALDYGRDIAEALAAAHAQGIVHRGIAMFRDATGRPGPSTWERGTYKDGEAEWPVNGVSWYEAAAYGAYAGKSLPTVYHWYYASGAFRTFSEILRFSNFGGRGTARVAFPVVWVRTARTTWPATSRSGPGTRAARATGSCSGVRGTSRLISFVMRTRALHSSAVRVSGSGVSGSRRRPRPG